ncbi:MAG: preprotein translocase subunit YajC [Alphaproteobacteria bacterium]|nr:preprotein translocase subunit YajC [Alphaproteobacteria bacterium]
MLIAPAFAQDAADAAPSNPNATLMQYVPFALILLVFYFIVIRPQQKKITEQEKMIKALQRGDRIVTNAGIHGKIVRLEGDDHVILEIADGVQIKMEKSHVNGLAAKTEPAADSDKK